MEQQVITDISLSLPVLLGLLSITHQLKKVTLLSYSQAANG